MPCTRASGARALKAELLASDARARQVLNPARRQGLVSEAATTTRAQAAALPRTDNAWVDDQIEIRPVERQDVAFRPEMHQSSPVTHQPVRRQNQEAQAGADRPTTGFPCGSVTGSPPCARAMRRGRQWNALTLRVRTRGKAMNDLVRRKRISRCRPSRESQSTVPAAASEVSIPPITNAKIPLDGAQR